MPDFSTNRNSQLRGGSINGRTLSRINSGQAGRTSTGQTTSGTTARGTMRSSAAARRNSSRRRISAAGRRRGSAVKGAQNQLKRFRQGSILAVAITGFLLLLFTPAESGYSQDTSAVVETTAATEEITPDPAPAAASDTSESEAQENNAPITTAAKDEAFGAFQSLWDRFYRNLPKILVAIGILLVAWLLSRFLRWVLHRIIGNWERSGGIIAISNIVLWLFAIGLAISVVVGDIRAMVGSLGLIGLALSWSLQTPIESFTGWIFNSFKGYYRIGDRISVGDVVGDVYRIDFLTTTVWEIGSPFRQGYLQAEQPTGRLVTFPNNEVLAGSVVNYTSDFPFVWDELIIGVANESDIRLSMQVLEKAAIELLGDYMKEPAAMYTKILEQAGLHYPVSAVPQVYLSTTDSWTNIIIRYLVGARERRKWKTDLILATSDEMARPEYRNKIIPVYTRQQIQLIDIEGTPVELDSFTDGDEEEKKNPREGKQTNL